MSELLVYGDRQYLRKRANVANRHDGIGTVVERISAQHHPEVRRIWSWTENGPVWELSGGRQTWEANPLRKRENTANGHDISRIYAQWKRLDARARTPEELFRQLFVKLYENYERSTYTIMSTWDAFKQLAPDAWTNLDGMWKCIADENRHSSDCNPWKECEWMRRSPYTDMHGLRPSAENPAMLIYARTFADGARNKWVRIKPGRYLKQFFPELGEAVIRQLSERYIAGTRPMKIQFIGSNDPDGWVRIYADGPESCMAGEDMADCVRVYAHPKSVLRLAYQESDDGAIVSRAIVREDLKQYVRVYPNPNDPESVRIRNNLTMGLEQLGYSHGGLNGMLLLRIEHRGRDNQWVMPYIDHGANGYQNVSEKVVDGVVYWEIGSRGMSATSTNGFIYDTPPAVCASCDEECDPDDVTEVADGETVCSSCLNESYTEAWGRGTNRVYANNQFVIECEGEYYVDEPRVLTDHGVVQGYGRRGREAYFLRENCIEVNDYWYHTDYLDDNGIHMCTLTDEYMHEDDMVQVAPNGDWVDRENDRVVELEHECNGYEYALRKE